MISQVFNIDCMIGMADYPDKYFDLAVVDPPYGVNAGKKTEYHNGAFTSYTAKEWDNARPSAEYFSALFRVSQYQIIWGGNYFTEYLPPHKNWIVWDKAQPLGISLSMHELAFCNVPGQATIFRVTNGSNGNRCVVKNSSREYQRIHPTQKPVKLYSFIYHNYLPNGGKVLDTHLGSGSNRIAAHKAGNIDFTAYELDKEYYEAQEKRYKDFTSQTVMAF